MKILYVTTGGAPRAAGALAGLIDLDPSIEFVTVEGAEGALDAIRGGTAYSALFVSPSVSRDEALAVLSSLGRDRAPISIVAIGQESQQTFLSQAAGASAALKAAEERIDVLSRAAQTATIALTTLRADHDQLRETQAFERALRDRDREALTSVTRALREAEERSQVLETTLNQSEDRARAARASLEQAHAVEVRRLQESVAKAADRLHQVAHSTQVLQSRLERQLADRIAERDRLTENALVGHAVFTLEGRLVRCSESFSSLLGYDEPSDAIAAGNAGPFPGTPDHQAVLWRLDRGRPVDRAMSTLRRADGRPVRVLTSAVEVPTHEVDESGRLIERIFVDLSGQAAAEKELRLARRLESAGRLAAEMAPAIEEALSALESADVAAPDTTERASALVRQLVAFSRHQAKPAGYLSLNDAIRRLEPLLRQVAGGATEVRLALGPVEPVTAGEDDVEQLIIDLVTDAAGCLPFGGRLTISTFSETDSTFALNTSLTATAAGYGVLPCVSSSSLARHAGRCGGTLRTSGDAGSTTLHVNLPC